MVPSASTPPLNCPDNTTPFQAVKEPYPSYLLFSKAPLYTVPSGKVNSPSPWKSPFTNTPSYLTPNLTSTPFPLGYPSLNSPS